MTHATRIIVGLGFFLLVVVAIAILGLLVVAVFYGPAALAIFFGREWLWLYVPIVLVLAYWIGREREEGSRWVTK